MNKHMANFLIVDKNILANSSLLAKIRMAGHGAEAVTEFFDNEPIVTKARVMQPDMIVIDPTFTGSHDGFSLVSDLKAHPETKQILLVACSDSPDLKMRERLINLGASTHYDRSRIETEELIGRLEKIIMNKEKYEA